MTEVSSNLRQPPVTNIAQHLPPQQLTTRLDATSAFDMHAVSDGDLAPRLPLGLDSADGESVLRSPSSSSGRASHKSLEDYEELEGMSSPPSTSDSPRRPSEEVPRESNALAACASGSASSPSESSRDNAPLAHVGSRNKRKNFKPMNILACEDNDFGANSDDEELSREQNGTAQRSCLRPVSPTSHERAIATSIPGIRCTLQRSESISSSQFRPLDLSQGEVPAERTNGKAKPVASSKMSNDDLEYGAMDLSRTRSVSDDEGSDLRVAIDRTRSKDTMSEFLGLCALNGASAAAVAGSLEPKRPLEPLIVAQSGKHAAAPL